jgi:hypothetical protein
MPERKNDPAKDKISPEFAARLERLDSHQRIRAIVFLQIPGSEATSRRRRTRSDREVAAERVRSATAEYLAEIDAILKRSGGRRLAERPDALGSVPVEATARGLVALAASEHVTAVLDDQPARLLS